MYMCMRTFSYVALLASLATTNLANTINIDKPAYSGSFTLNAVGVRGSRSLNKRSIGRVDAVTQAEPKTDLFWIVEIEIGTPPQKLNVTIDTGSGSLFVQGGSTKVDQSHHATYKPTESSTFDNHTSRPFSVNFDAGGFNGYFTNDTVSVGGISIDGAQFAITPASSSNAGTQMQQSDTAGIMGMAPTFPTGMPKGADTPFSAIIAPHLDQPVMTANLFNDTVGTYTFGHIDSAQFTGALNWVPANNSGQSWTLEDLWFSIDGVPTDTSGGHNIMVDTDGAGFSYDLPLVREYYSRIPNARDTSPGKNGTSWAFPCNSKLPNLQVRFGRNAQNIATIFGAKFDMGPIGSNQGVDMCGSCFTAAFGRNFGAPFLMSNFVAFEFPQSLHGEVRVPRVGIAGKVGGGGDGEGKKGPPGGGNDGIMKAGGKLGGSNGEEGGSGKKEVVVVETVVEEEFVVG